MWVCGLAMGDIGGSEDKYPENVSTCDKYCQNKVDSLSFCTENRSKCHLIDNHAKQEISSLSYLNPWQNVEG